MNLHVKKMAQELEISVGSVHTASARWVSHHLTSDQAERCLEVATANLSRFNFLSRIIAIEVIGARIAGGSNVSKRSLRGVLTTHKFLLAKRSMVNTTRHIFKSTSDQRSGRSNLSFWLKD